MYSYLAYPSFSLFGVVVVVSLLTLLINLPGAKAWMVVPHDTIVATIIVTPVVT